MKSRKSLKRARSHTTLSNYSSEEEQILSEPNLPSSAFFCKFGVTKPYDFPKGKRDLKKERFIFNETFAPNHKVMVQRSNLSYIRERKVLSESPPKTIK